MVWYGMVWYVMVWYGMVWYHVFTSPQLLLHGAAGTAGGSGSGAGGGDGAYVAAVRRTITIGGENADRGSFVGSILAAAHGSLDAIPSSWRRRTTRYDEMLAVAEAIADGGIADGGSPRAPTSAEGGAPATEAAPASPAAQHAARLGESPTPQPQDGQQQQQDHRHRALVRYGESPASRVGNSRGCIAHSNHTTANGTRPPSHPDDVRALRALCLPRSFRTRALPLGALLPLSTFPIWQVPRHARARPMGTQRVLVERVGASLLVGPGALDIAS